MSKIEDKLLFILVFPPLSDPNSSRISLWHRATSFAMGTPNRSLMFIKLHHGFWSRASGASKRICDFIIETGIPQGQFICCRRSKIRLRGLVWSRKDDWSKDYQPSIRANWWTLCQRPVEKITQEYYWEIYDPVAYLDWTFRHFWMMNSWSGKSNWKLDPNIWQVFKSIMWRQGVKRSTRFRFWWNLAMMALLKSNLIEE